MKVRVELLKDRMNKLTKTSNYRFKADIVKSILKQFKNNFLIKENLNKAIAIDSKKFPVYIDFNKMVKIIDNQISNDKFCLKFKPENIIDGYGTIAVRI